MSKNIILGYGILGKELVKQSGWDYLSRSLNKNFNFKDSNSYKEIISSYNTVINCIANTDTYSQDKEEHWNVNYKSVSDLINICNKNNQKIIDISTDYIYSGSISNASITDVPVHNQTWYGYTKLLGDAYVQLKANNYLIIRCGHKPRPFPYDKGFEDVIGNFDYIDKIVELIIKLINDDIKGIRNVGTGLKTMYDLALETKPDIIKTKSDNQLMPKDVSMRIKK